METLQEKNMRLADEKVAKASGTGTPITPENNFGYASNMVGVNTAPQVITSDITNQTKQISLPQTPVTTTASAISGMTDGVKTSAQSEYDRQVKANEELAKSKVDTSSTNLASLLNEQLGVQGSRANLETTAGLDKKAQDLTDITNKIEASQRAQTNELRALQDNPNLDAFGIQAQTQAINRKYAFEQADLALIQSARNRDYATAQNIVDRKIELALEPIKLKYDYYKSINEGDKSAFTSAQQKTLANLETKAKNEYETQKKQAETLESARIETLKNLNDNGAPESVKQAVVNAKTTSEMLNAAGTYGADLKKQLEIKKLQAEVDVLAGKTGGKSDDLVAYSSQYADTGKLPSPAELKQSGLTVGQVTQLASTLPKPKGAIVSTNTGVKSSALSTVEESGLTALSEIVTQTLPELQRLFPKLYTGLIGGIVGNIYTTQDRQDYLTFRQEFLSKLLQARSGATVTPQEYDRYAALLPTEFNQSLFFGSDGSKKLKSLLDATKTTLDNQLNAKQQSIYGYSKVKVGGVDRTVGEEIDIGGTLYRVLPNGKLTDVI